MTFRKSFLSLALLTVLLASDVAAQPWMDNVPVGDENNFYAIQNAFNDYWSGKDFKEKGKGWKAFKRWEWFWGPRVYPTGEFPNRMQLFEEYQRTGGRRPETGDRLVSVANWTELGPSDSPGGYAGLGRLNCVRTQPGDVNTIWVGSAGGGLWKSTDGGVTWASNTDELPTLGVTDVAFDPTDSQIMYIATGDGDAGDDYSVGVLKSTDGGETWNTTGLNWPTSQATVLSRLLIRPDDPNALIAAGNGIFKTTDAGVTWTQPSTIRIHDLEFKPGDPSTIYASGASSNVLRSTDSGATWIALTNGLPSSGRRVAISVTPANPSYVYALIANASSGFYGLYRSTDSGDSWSLRSSSPNILGYNVDGSDAGGQGWYDLAIAASETNAETVYTGGINIWKSTNGGTSWAISTFWYYIPGIPEVHADKHDLYIAPGTNTIFTGCDGGIYRSTDSGTTWQWIGAGLKITQFYRLGTSQTDPGRLIAGAQDNGTKALGGGVWTDHIGGDGMESLVDYTDANIMYATLYYGDIFRTTNGGGSWLQINGGVPESGGWITPYVIHPTDPLTLFGGYRHVWQTTNRGTTWTSISNFGSSTLELLVVAPSDPKYLYAGTGALIHRTTDGGETDWTTITRPTGSGYTTSIAIHSLDPNHIWMTSSGFTSGQKVYESRDGGGTWTNVSGNLPNVPVNCIVYENNSPDRVYVGTDIGVFYRDLSVSDWQDFNEGLANVSITELELQYATNKIRASTYGRGVWESDAVVSSGAVIGLSQSSIDFGRLEADSSFAEVGVTIINYGTVDSLVVTSVALSGSDFTISTQYPVPFTLGPSESALITVRFEPDSPGDAIDSVAIASNASNGATIRVPVSGRGVVIGEASSGVMYAAGASLYSVDVGTGAVTLLGETGVAEIQSLTVRPTNKELYGMLSGPASSTLYRVSSSSGDALPAQTFDVGYLRAIAFSANDTIYGVVTYGLDAGNLYRLDLATGVATYIGTTASTTYSSLAFSPASGKLWASDRPPVGIKDKIYIVNTQTGEATLRGQTGFPSRITAAIAFDTGGRLFGITGSGTQTNEFIQIDTSTAAGTLIGEMGTTGLTALTMRIDSLILDVGTRQQSEIPHSLVLEQNYPNPFNPVTEIRYGVPRQGHVTLDVYNMLGQEVVRLHDGVQSAGFHVATWNGTNASGSPAASGIYFYKLEGMGEDGRTFQIIKKMIFMK